MKQNEIDRLVGVLAVCRDAFPIPKVGSALEGLWLEAMADPIQVGAYVVAQAHQLQENLESLNRRYDSLTKDEEEIWNFVTASLEERMKKS